jgi:S1-C subfamily serine protease
VNLADVIMLGMIAAAAVGGYRMGLVARLVSWVTTLAALLVALRLLPVVLGWLDDPDQFTVLAVSVIVIVVGMFVGQAVGVAMGSRLRPPAVSGPLVAADRALGAAAGAAGVLLVLWLLMPLLTGSTGAVSSAMTNSVVARTLANNLPDPPDAAQALRGLVGDAPFPEVFESLRPSPDLGPPPDGTGLTAEVAQRVADSVVLVRATGCGRLQNGTGFVAPAVVSGSPVLVTNAHVIAGTSSVEVQRSDGRWFDAVVVAFDPVRDVAVLSATDVPWTSLPLVSGSAGSVGGVFGHPGGNPLRIAPSRISSEIEARGRDIYGRPGANRQVLELAATLAPGDSGAPMVGDDGSVMGLVFAVALDRGNVAYALTVAEVDAVLAPLGATQPAVDTGRCL